VLAEMALAVGARRDRVREALARRVHWLAEIEKRAFRDRNRCLGDPSSAASASASSPTRARSTASSRRSTRAARRPRRRARAVFPERAHDHALLRDGRGGHGASRSRRR
jgi:gamma-glutamyltranspeptidase